MPNGSPSREQIDRFLIDQIDSVPQLEALLLMWRNRPRRWTSTQIAKSLYISVDLATAELNHLLHHGIISAVEDSPGTYVLNLEPEDRMSLLAELDEMHRRELVRISNLIHGKAPRAMRDFANAFRFKKEERK